MCDSDHVISPREMRALDEHFMVEKEASNQGAIDRILMSKQEQGNPGYDSQTHKAQSSQTEVQSVE